MDTNNSTTAPSFQKTGPGAPRRKLRLAYFVSHPIQYQAPLLRRIASEADIDLKVFFSTDISVRGHKDPGFGVDVKWDVPLLSGYDYEFLPRRRNSESLSSFSPLNWGIYRRLRDGHYDAIWVHGYSTPTALQALFAARRLKIPALIRSDSTLFDRYRSRPKRALKAFFFRILKGCISGVLSVGEANSEYWRHHLGKKVPIFSLYYAVDNDFFQQRCREASTKREDFRRELGLDPGRPVVLFASKLQKRKRCEDLLEAFLKLTAKGGTRSAPYLLIVGDGEERAVLEQRAKAACTGDVRFLGFQNQTALPGFFDLCDVFVLASVDEPWGLVINEVMNAGRPVIVSDEVGCQRDLVDDGVTGLVVPARNVDALENSLERILANPRWARGMGLNGMKKVQDFNFEQNVSELRRALQTVVPDFTMLKRPPLPQLATE